MQEFIDKLKKDREEEIKEYMKTGDKNILKNIFIVQNIITKKTLFFLIFITLVHKNYFIFLPPLCVKSFLFILRFCDRMY